MSLRAVFWLMGLVTSLMIAGVIYTKVIREPVMTVGEMRALDRVCDTRCAGLAKSASERIADADDLERYARECVDQCRTRMYAGRIGKTVPASEAVAPSLAPPAPTAAVPGDATATP